MSSSNSRSYYQNQSWQHLVATYQGRISSYNRAAHEYADSLSSAYSEETFRDQFEALCRQQGEVQYSRLQARLDFRSIDTFVNAVDSVEGHSSTGGLAAVVYGGTLVAVQAASSIEGALTNIVTLLGNLNRHVPRVGAMVRSCGENSRLQKLLHEIFEQYMGALLSVIAAYSYVTRTSIPHVFFQSIDAHIDFAIREFTRQNESFLRVYNQSLTRPPRSVGHWSSLSSRSVASNTHIATLPQSSQYKQGQVLGHGSRGVEVHLVTKISTGREFARKRIPLSGSEDEVAALANLIAREVENMEKLTHKHVARIFDTERFPTPSPDRPGLPGYYDLFIRPVADMTLREYLVKCSTENYLTQSLQKIVPWFGCLMAALRHAHQNGIAHMDIKPRNILICGDQVYLADFGISKDTLINATGHTLGDDGFGTPAYRAPELVSGASRGFPADVFSLGCVFSEMLTVYAHLSLDAYDTYRNNPEARPRGAFRHNLEYVKVWTRNLEQTASGPVFGMVHYLVQTMMEPDPSVRNTSARLWPIIKQDPSFWCGNH